MNRLPIAPTTLSLYRKCPRAWGFRKIAKIPSRATKGKTDGKIAHSYLERYYQAGQHPPTDNFHGRLAAALVPHLPEPGPEIVSERHLVLDTGSPLHYWHGYPDIARAGEVWDAKFYAASSRKYMVTTETLQRDPQAIVYGAYFATARGARFTMNYVIKPADQLGVPKVEPVRAAFTLAELDRALEEFDRLAVQIVWYLTNVTDPNRIPHNADAACEGVGLKCDYAGHCALHELGEKPPWDQ